MSNTAQDTGAGFALGGPIGAGLGYLAANGGGSGGGNPSYPGILPAFSGDVSQMRDFANSMAGQKLPGGAFQPSPGMMNAANLGNNYFGAGGPGSSGMGYLNNVLQGNYLRPESNPYLQGNIESMQRAFQNTMGMGIDKLNAQFAGSGQYGGNSGARNDALLNFGVDEMRNFGDSITNFLGSNYQKERGIQQNALGMMGMPLQSAGMASAFGQAPGELAYQGQTAQNQLSSMPFNMMMELMKNTPVAYPQYEPYRPGFSDYLMQGLGQGVGNLPMAFSIPV